ncbi:MAG: class I SAM-dependent methyltransferase [Candidatus Binataceae bacterium]
MAIAFTAEASTGAADYYPFDDINYAMVRLFKANQPAGGRAPTVLSLGCGRARLELELERLGATVTGIDSNPGACVTARERIHEVIETDLTRPEKAVAILGERRFDWIIAADVLEHFADGGALLRDYLRFLAPAGRLIVSLPNVALWSNRLHLLLGRFDYEPTGVRDRTHLRFYTIKTAHQLLRAVGLTPLKVGYEPGMVRTFLPLIRRLAVRGNEPGAILDSPAYNFYRRWVLPVETAICNLTPGLLALRIVILATADTTEAQSRGGSPANI